MAKAKIQETPRAKGWTAYEGYGIGVIVIRADGEIVTSGLRNGRPATKTEIKNEQARRAKEAEHVKRIEAFRARPEWQDADTIRSTIEIMEVDAHPLDCMTPEEWRALRIRISGRRADD